MASSSYAIEINRVRDSHREPTSDRVATEEPLEIRIGCSLPEGHAVHSISVTMRTPGHDEALAAGFLFSESIIHGASDIAGIEGHVGDNRRLFELAVGRTGADELGAAYR